MWQVQLVPLNFPPISVPTSLGVHPKTQINPPKHNFRYETSIKLSNQRAQFNSKTLKTNNPETEREGRRESSYRIFENETSTTHELLTELLTTFVRDIIPRNYEPLSQRDIFTDLVHLSVDNPPL